MAEGELIANSDPITKKSREKSVRYPANNLKQCLDFLSIVHTIGGKKEAPVESILSKMNLTSAETKSYKYLVSSAETFGLIEKTDTGIKSTSLGTLILFPPNGEDERKKKIIEAFKAPVFYQKIIERYDKMILPTNNILKNVFLHSGIATNSLDTAVNAFIESAQYANVLDSENRLSVETSAEIKEPIQQQSKGMNVPIDLPIQSNSDQKEILMKNLDINKLDILMSNGKLATLTLPVDATKEDIDKLIKLLKVFSGE